MFFARSVIMFAVRVHRLRQRTAAALLIGLFCLFAGQPLHAADLFDDLDTLKAAVAVSHQGPEAFFRTNERMRDAALIHARDVVRYIANKKKGTEDDSELFIQSLELVSYIIDPRAEDVLLSDVAFGTGWIVLHGVARQDPATVVPKLMVLFDRNRKTKVHPDVREDVGYVYGTMFENGRLSAGSPYYVKIRSQLLTLGASRKDDQRYVAAYALRRMPQDTEVTRALERLAKDTSSDDSIRHNAAKALVDRSELFKSGRTPPVR